VKRRVGFTLIEVMMAMVIFAVVMTAVVSLLMSQVRYVSQIGSDVQVLEQVNTAQSLLSSEIASLTRGSVRFARADSVVVALPLSWGVVCGPIDRHLTSAPPANKKSKKGAATPVYSTTAALSLEPPAADLGSPVPDGFALSTDGANYTYYPVATWSTLGLANDTTAALACMTRPSVSSGGKKDPKKAVATPPTTTTLYAPREEYWRSTGLAGAVGEAPDGGSLMLTYLTVSYFFRAESGGMFLYRSSKLGAQKLAGPFDWQAGFLYRLANGTSATSIVSASLPNIRAIRPTLVAVRRSRQTVKADTLTINPWMYLFNAQ
jgi:prepilin-type N-terminal cleavage/methylation domain-containing protein